MRKLEGIRRRGDKWQAYVDIGGRQKSKRFPLTTPLDDIRKWRQDELKKRRAPDAAPADGSFADDVQHYLARIAAQPSARQKAAQLALWIHELGGTRTRRSITAEEIEVICNRWMTEPLPPRPAGHPGRPPASPTRELSVASVLKRRTTLQSFFNRMDGRKSLFPNPARLAELPAMPKAETRGITFPLVERVIARMPIYRTSTKRDAPRELALATIFARVIAYTGLPPGMLNKVTANDLVLVGPKATVRVLARRKAGGVEPRTLVLNPEARAAFSAFHDANAYGQLPAGLNTSVKRAAEKEGIPWGTFRLYDVRHSYLAQQYRAHRDLATVGRLALHAEGSKATARYARLANEEVDVAAQAAFSASIKTQRRLALKAVPKAATGAGRRYKILPRNPASGAKLASVR